LFDKAKKVQEFFSGQVRLGTCLLQVLLLHENTLVACVDATVGVRPVTLILKS